ncbi:hypothetical protein LJB86_04460 [Deltaproteobacteria bacterium OttesenSCG-928-M10]|nr:hypothetical protein [Deltaproteobacteria bacterium OttesenSCG-928-M10]
MAKHPEMQEYWGPHVKRDIWLSEGELVARHRFLMKELGIEIDEYGMPVDKKEQAPYPAPPNSGRPGDSGSPAAPKPLLLAQTERADVMSDAVPARPEGTAAAQPGLDLNETRKPAPKTWGWDKNNPTRKKIDAANRARREEAKEAERKALEEKRRLAEAGAAPKSSTPSWPKDLGSTPWPTESTIWIQDDQLRKDAGEAPAQSKGPTPSWPKDLGADGWPDSEQKKTIPLDTSFDRRKPAWQISSDAYVNKMRTIGPVGATNHSADLTSMNFLSKQLVKNRARELEAQKADIKLKRHPAYSNKPLLESDAKYQEIRRKIDPYLVEEPLAEHLAKDKYKGIAWMYEGYTKYELKSIKMTESMLEALYEARQRFQIGAEQAAEYPALHSAAKVLNPASILMVTPVGRATYLAGGAKLAIPFSALAGAGSVEVDRQVKAEFLYMIGIKTPPIASWDDIALGGVQGGLSAPSVVGGTAVSMFSQWLKDYYDKETKK